MPKLVTRRMPRYLPCAQQFARFVCPHLRTCLPVCDQLTGRRVPPCLTSGTGWSRLRSTTGNFPVGARDRWRASPDACPCSLQMATATCTLWLRYNFRNQYPIFILHQFQEITQPPDPSSLPPCLPALTAVRQAPCPMPHAVRQAPHAPCPMLHAPCPMHLAPWLGYDIRILNPFACKMNKCPEKVIRRSGLMNKCGGNGKRGLILGEDCENERAINQAYR